MKKKYPSDLNTRLIRVNAGDHFVLQELSVRMGVPINEVVRRLIIKRREVKVGGEVGKSLFC